MGINMAHFKHLVMVPVATNVILKSWEIYIKLAIVTSNSNKLKQNIKFVAKFALVYLF